MESADTWLGRRVPLQRCQQFQPVSFTSTILTCALYLPVGTGAGGLGHHRKHIVAELVRVEEVAVLQRLAQLAVQRLQRDALEVSLQLA